METVINQHGIDIEALKSSRLPMAGGTQTGDSATTQFGGNMLAVKLLLRYFCIILKNCFLNILMQGLLKLLGFQKIPEWVWLKMKGLKLINLVQAGHLLVQAVEDMNFIKDPELIGVVSLLIMKVRLVWTLGLLTHSHKKGVIRLTGTNR